MTALSGAFLADFHKKAAGNGITKMRFGFG